MRHTQKTPTHTQKVHNVQKQQAGKVTTEFSHRLKFKTKKVRKVCFHLTSTHTHTSDRLLQELGDGVGVVGVDGTGEHKLPLHLREAFFQQSPAPTQWLSHQGLHAHTHTNTHRQTHIHTHHYKWQNCIITTISSS